ncbi:hypothetical protein Pelo_17175 [Pelomyxa schiedti]|nr:hypothetical protein Pelo_17175 [Pelomyxa schiedti]
MALSWGQMIDPTAFFKRQGVVLSKWVLVSTTVLLHCAYAVFSPEYSIAVSGSAGSLNEGYFAGIIAAMKEPFYIPSINPVLVSIPTDCVNSAVGLVTSINIDSNSSLAWTTSLIIISPESSCSGNLSGTYGIEFFVGCIQPDPNCEDYIQNHFPSFLGYVDLYFYHETTKTEEIESLLIARTYDADGSFDTSFQAGQTVIVEDVISTNGGTPASNCTCNTEMFVYAWSGTLIGNYSLDTDELFNLTPLLVSPLENKFSIYLDPSAFPALNGELVQISTRCGINWGKDLTAISGTQKNSLETNPQPCFAATTANCTYEEYGNNNHHVTIYPHNSMITVTVEGYGLGSLAFPEGQNGKMCEYSTDSHNGWVVTSSETNDCALTVTRDFAADFFITNCAEIVRTTNGDYEMHTTMEEHTVPLYSGAMFGTILTVTVNSFFYNEMLLPSSTESEKIEITLYQPPEYSVSVSGAIGTMGENDYSNFVAMISAPYCVTSVNPIPVAVPNNTLGAVVKVTSITSTPHSVSRVMLLVMIYPEENCEISGEFVFELFVECLTEDPTCDDDVLQDFQSFSAGCVIAVPECKNWEWNTALSIRPYDEDEKFKMSFRPGATLIIDENITTYGTVPENVCDCTTVLSLYNSSGNLIGHYNVQTEAHLFHTTSLLLSPLENKFSVYLDPSIFADKTHGEVVQINATCVINWGMGQSQSVHGVAMVAVGSVDDSSSIHDGQDNALVIGVSVGVVGVLIVAASIVVLVVLIKYAKGKRQARAKTPVFAIDFPL